MFGGFVSASCLWLLGGQISEPIILADTYEMLPQLESSISFPRLVVFFWAVTCDSNLCVTTWESRESPRAPLFEDIGLRSFLCRLTIEKLIRLKISIWTIHDCLRCAGVMATNFKFHFELVRNHYALLSTGSSHVNQSMSCASEQLCFEIYHCFIAWLA